jgi:hypothetical protein
MKRLITALFLLALITTVRLYAQSNYNDYSYGDKTSIFYDEFTDNENSWPTENGEIYYWYYKFRSTDEKQHAAGKPISINTSGDFEIELTIKLASGSKTKFINLEWGWNNETGERFDFGFCNGAHTIDKFVNGAYQDYVNESNSSYVKNDDFNTLTVRKVGSTYYFFLNENLVHTMPFEPFFGDRIGFSVPGYSEVNVDKLKVSTLASKGYTPSNNGPSTPGVPGVPNAPGIGSNTTSSSDPSVYSYSGTKEKFFLDDFYDNSNGWAEKDDEKVTININGGNLNFKTNQDIFYSAWKTLDLFDESRNWEIESRMKFVSGQAKYENCIIWGGADGKSLRFGFTGNGSYTAYRIDDGTITDFRDYTFSSELKNSDYNILTVRKVGNQLYFFINQVFIMSAGNEPFYGKRFGFLVGKSTLMKFDYIKISYLN